MNDYDKFKKLLEYFVAHLEYCQTGQATGEGYKQYIKNIDNFIKSGQGHKGHNIQKQIENWDTYPNGLIKINVYPTSYTGKGCYLNWHDTAINVIAEWDDKKETIIGLKIVKDSYPISNAKSVISFNLQQLGLLDKQQPSEHLKTFFNTFNELKMQLNEGKNNKQEMKHIEPYIQTLLATKNVILTGAPGTGKTFLAKEIAKQIIGINVGNVLEESEQFAFVQFHPSYDYTDFVEGLRPTAPDENGTIGFELKEGIFKRFCQIAATANLTEMVDNFDMAWENLLAAVRLNISKGILTKIGSWDYGLSSKDSLKYSSVNTPSQYNFTITKKNVYDAYQGKQARPSGAFQKDMEDVVNYMKSNYGLITVVKNKNENENQGIKNYVFVIDEINRGEISKIFGELFFSIDPSYRGKKGAVKTQYSNLHDDPKEVFYVPENVYIIGSMNDIDRSVESFDFAMRRRFTWMEITALQSAVNMNLPQEAILRMTKLNEQISEIEGLNDSYHIGAAYFLDTNGNARKDFDNIWSLRIEPLLKEYLRGMVDSADKIEILKNAFNTK